MEQEITYYPGSQLMNDYMNWFGHDALYQDYLDNLNMIYGTESSETVIGTNYNDMLDGYATDGKRGDMLLTGLGDDLIFLTDAGSGVIDSCSTDHDTVVTMHDYLNEQDHYGSTVEEVKLWYGDDLTIDMTGADWNTTLSGNSGSNTITGGSGSDYIMGMAGNDVLFGADGDDMLFGGGDRDTIDGGAGDDMIRGGSGDDVLSGGAGADSFYFQTLGGSQNDQITDFESGIDVLDIWDADMDLFNMVSGVDGTEITYGAGKSIFIDGDGVDDIAISDINFHESDFLIL